MVLVNVRCHFCCYIQPISPYNSTFSMAVAGARIHSALTLPSGELLHLPPRTRLILETDDMGAASPALLSRCAVVRDESLAWLIALSYYIRTRACPLSGVVHALAVAHHPTSPYSHTARTTTSPTVWLFPLIECYRRRIALVHCSLSLSPDLRGTRYPGPCCLPSPLLCSHADALPAR